MQAASRREWTQIRRLLVMTESERMQEVAEGQAEEAAPQHQINGEVVEVMETGKGEDEVVVSQSQDGVEESVSTETPEQVQNNGDKVASAAIAKEVPSRELEQAVGETKELSATDIQSNGETVNGTAGVSFTPVKKDEDVRPRRLKDLEVGMELDGRVTSVALYGVFVDIGVGRDGLVHISEMSDTRINSPSDMVQIGDAVKVRVKSIDPDARRISLTMRSPREQVTEEDRTRGRQKRSEIDREALSNLKVGDTVQGTITGMAPFGAFVDIGVGKDGLVHISELSDHRVEKPEEAVQVNQQYTFKLLEVDSEGNRISLSLRRHSGFKRCSSSHLGRLLKAP